MGRKRRYILDENTLDYVLIEPDKKTKRRGIVKIILSSAILSMLLFVLLPDGFTDFQLLKSKLKKREIKPRIDSLAMRSVGLEKKLDSLFYTDSVYNTLLGRERLPKSMTTAGQGGSEITLPLAGESNDVLIDLVKTSQILLGKTRVKEYSLTEIETALSQIKRKRVHTPSIQPIATTDLTYWGSGFSQSRFHPILNIIRKHEGVDMNAKTGTPIHAPANGVIKEVRRSLSFGNVVVMQHGYTLETLYAHLSRFNVEKGDSISRGDTLGFVGNTGLSEGPHLHYEIHMNGIPVNPMNYIHEKVSQYDFERIISSRSK